jgi:hypothetical protein
MPASKRELACRGGVMLRVPTMTSARAQGWRGGGWNGCKRVVGTQEKRYVPTQLLP